MRISDTIGLVAAILLGLLAPVSALTNQSAHETVSPVWRWGPYRPNLYFGVRPQIPNTILMGLMWGNGESQETMVRCKLALPPSIEHTLMTAARRSTP
jgi:hypothetical protein